MELSPQLMLYALVPLASFNTGMLVPLAVQAWGRRRAARQPVRRHGSIVVTKHDIRSELARDPVAIKMFADDDTPEDVQRYLYLEAERRAVLRKQKILTDAENDFFAPPRRSGPDPGFRTG